MVATDISVQDQTAFTADPVTLFISLELSRAKWLVTSASPDSKKLSKHTITGGDGNTLLDLVARLKGKAEQRIGSSIKVVTIQEAGLDGFWIHRLLFANGVESHVVEAASVAMPKRHRRTKTDRIDGEILIRTLMAFKRGEPRVCSIDLALKSWTLKIARRHGLRNARAALARRLAVIMHAMRRDGTLFQA